jgi:DNA mismatch endonuclease (patch repair protein)
MRRAVPRPPVVSSPAIRATMRANRAKDTTPELAVRSLLRQEGLTGYRLHWRTPAGRVDIAFVSRKVAIEVYGCFWHRCPRCALPLPKRNRAFWRSKFRANLLRDERSKKSLKEAGWRLFVLRECQIRREDFHLPKRLVAALSY